MADLWTHIRVRPATKEALAEIIAAIETTFDNRNMRGWWPGDHLTYDALIEKLVQRHRQHMARGEKHAQKRRRERLFQAAGQPPTPAEQARIGEMIEAVFEILDGAGAETIRRRLIGLPIVGSPNPD